MKVRVYETVTEHVDVEVEDGLDPESDEFAEAVEDARVNTAAARVFDSVENVDWEVLP